MFRIEYKDGGDSKGMQIVDGPLDEAIAQAEVGMISHEANFACIIDQDGTGAEVWSGRNDANRT